MMRINNLLSRVQAAFPVIAIHIKAIIITIRKGNYILATYLRRTTDNDLPEIGGIIESAKLLLKANGINQWQDGYPDETALQNDIRQQVSYVLIIDGQIAGTGVILNQVDPSYEEIEEGSWAGPEKSAYSSIHRTAMSPEFRGRHLSSLLMGYLISAAGLTGHADIRIDTHPDNQAMQRVIRNAGFDYRGIIYLNKPDGKRRAYQLLLP